MFYPMLVPKHIFSTIPQLNFRRKHGRGDRMATAQVLHEEQLTDGTSVCTLHITHCSREATMCLLTALLHYFHKARCPLPYLNLVFQSRLITLSKRHHVLHKFMIQEIPML